MDVIEFKKLIEKEENINVEENKMDNQKAEMKNKILESLYGLTISDGTVSFDKKKNEKIQNQNYNYNKETVNIIVAGKTGVGKSSLINYIFGEKVAEVGVGAPVTQEIGAYHLKEDNINLYDTKGIETEDYEETLSNIQNF
ncbi:GTPase [Leptotrichia sp. HSP-536]|uniref:GTPase n=1 Tax=Leptotrichia alba TaxID=3239304 RepID=A0AB39V1I7_9FUSO